MGEMETLIGMHSLELAISGGNVTVFGREPEAYAFENGVLVFHGGVLDDTVTLRADGSVSIEILGITFYCSRVGGEPAGAAPAQDNALAAYGAYLGEWYGIYISAGASQGNPQELWGLVIRLTLNADGSGVLDYGGPDSGKVWYYDAENDCVYYGAHTPDSADTLLSIMDEGYLMYGTPLSGYIVFSHNPQDQLTAIPTVQPYVMETPAPAAQPESVATGNAADKLEKRFVVVSAISSGVVIPAETLGAEYAIIFHDNGFADFTMSGVEVTGLSWWVNEAGLMEVNYYGTIITFTPTAEGLDMDFFGSMLMKMAEQ